MKKHVSLVLGAALLVSLVAPKPALASWWNPFSWFRKAPAEVHVIPPAPPAESLSTTSPETDAEATSTATSTQAEEPVSKPVSPSKPQMASVRADSKPVVKASVRGEIAATSSDSEATTTKPEKIVDVPAVSAAFNYLPSNFSQPKNIRQGTELLSLDTTEGSKSLGLWYIDSVSWTIVSDDMRAGDVTVGVSSKQNIVSDSSALNSPIATKLSAHAASDELSFHINGPLSAKGRFHIVVQEIMGHMKNDPTNAVYKFDGLPVIGPEFSL